jgi:hypothetical protein
MVGVHGRRRAIVGSRVQRSSLFLRFLGRCGRFIAAVMVLTASECMTLEQ